jgi:hypothetical protein
MGHHAVNPESRVRKLRMRSPAHAKSTVEIAISATTSELRSVRCPRLSPLPRPLSFSSSRNSLEIDRVFLSLVS